MVLIPLFASLGGRFDLGTYWRDEHDLRFMGAPTQEWRCCLPPRDDRLTPGVLAHLPALREGDPLRLSAKLRPPLSLRARGRAGEVKLPNPDDLLLGRRVDELAVPKSSH